MRILISKIRLSSNKSGTGTGRYTGKIRSGRICHKCSLGEIKMNIISVSFLYLYKASKVRIVFKFKLQKSRTIILAKTLKIKDTS